MTTKRIKIKKASSFAAEYIADLMASGCKVKIYIGDDK
jgi:hypothetical protein